MNPSALTVEQLRIAIAEGERIKRLEQHGLLDRIDYSALSPVQQLELARQVAQESK